jgi:hypothetical protein
MEMVSETEKDKLRHAPRERPPPISQPQNFFAEQRREKNRIYFAKR